MINLHVSRNWTLLELYIIRETKKRPRKKMQLSSLTIPVVSMASDMQLAFLGRKTIHLSLIIMNKLIKDLSPPKES